MDAAVLTLDCSREGVTTLLQSGPAPPPEPLDPQGYHRLTRLFHQEARQTC